MIERDIFTAARERTDPAARAAFLDDACADDAVLRARVERLLEADSAPDSILDIPAEKTPAVSDGVTRTIAPILDDKEGDGLTRTLTHNPGNSSPEFAETRAPEDGDADVDLKSLFTPAEEEGSIGRLDHYEVHAVIGRGGMGVVLKAHDTKLRRVVALKLLAPALAAVGSARRRFAREAQSAAAVRDEHVVDIHAVYEDRPIPYIVMDFVSGITLEDRIRAQGPFEVREVVRIGLQAARGLAAAHAQGLVHRDVKPGNILLEDGVQRVKLTDFGLARAADDASISRSGVIAGTPMYMSPEQAKGEKIDHRSDLFSLGSVLYTLCTGRPAFRAESTVAVLRRVCKEEARSIREVNPDMPKWMCAVVEKLMAKDPAARIQSASEVADLLSRYLAHLEDPDRVPPPPAVRGVRVRSARRFRPALALVAAIAVVATGAIGYLAIRERDDVEEAKGPEDPPEGKKDDGEWKPPTPEVLAARPSPLDGRKRAQIPAALLALAGGGDPARVPPEFVAILGHPVPFALPALAHTSVPAVSPDGKYLAVANGHDLLVFDVATGTLRNKLTGLKATLLRVAFSPDSKRVAAVSNRNTYVWNVESGSLVLRLECNADVYIATFSPDGKNIAAACSDGSVYLWDAEGRNRKALPRQRGGVDSLAFSPDSSTLAFAGSEGVVVLWDAAAGAIQKTLKGHTEWVHNVRFRPDGKALASSDDRQTILWDLESGSPRHTLPTSGRGLLAFTPDGTNLLAAREVEETKDGYRLTRWDVGTGKKTADVPLGVPGAKEATFYTTNRDCSIVYGCRLDSDTRVIAFDATSGKAMFTPQGHSGAVWAVAVSPDGRRIASGGEDGTIRMWEIGEWKAGSPLSPSRALTGHSATVYSVAFSPDGSLLASASQDGTVRLWGNGETSRTLARGDFKSATDVAFSADGKLLAAGAVDGSVRLWDVATGETQSPLRWHPKPVSGVAFSADNRYLASAGSGDLKVHITDLRTFRRVQTLGPAGEGKGALKVAFGGDGRTLAYGGWNDTVRLWDAVEKKDTVLSFSTTALREFTGGNPWRTSATINDLAVDPTGRFVAATRAGGLLVWDRNAPSRPITFDPGPFGDTARHVAFTPEGRYIVVAGSNGTVSIVRTPRPQDASPPTNSSTEAVAALRAALEAGPDSLASIATAPLASVPLTKADAATARSLLWNAHLALLRKERADEMKNRRITDGKLEMPFEFKTYGAKPNEGWSLYISLHGGGGAPKAINDSQWQNQQRLYTLAEGIYLTPRAPTDTWNLWHEDHVDRMLGRLIEDFIAIEGVNPNRVYVLGYGAGGDGAYQLAPRMADWWAAAAMMGGHPNNVSPLSLRNVPFALQVGANDRTYNRNTVAREFGETLDKLQKDDPKGYHHFVKIHEGKGVWMDGEDRIAIPWMAKFTRNPIPEKVVWKQGLVPHASSYWLAAPHGADLLGSHLTAQRNGQTIEISAAEQVNRFVLRFDDRMLDLDQPVIVTQAGKELFAGSLPRTVGVMIRTLIGRGDPDLVFDAEVEVVLPGYDRQGAAALVQKGALQMSQGKLTEAIAAYREAIRKDSQNYSAQFGLGLALLRNKQFDESIATYSLLLARNPNDSASHNNLGNGYSAKGQVDEAIACYRKSIECNPGNAIAHANLGVQMVDKKQWDEAIALYKKALELSPNYSTARAGLERAQRGAVEAKLPAFLKGEFKPTTNDERLGLVAWCAEKKLFGRVADLHVEIFAADPKLAEDLVAFRRYNAACYAVRAATGQGEDAAALDDKERARLRKLALVWLRADLVVRTRQLESGLRVAMHTAVKHWEKDADLAGIRGAAELAKLPEAERAEFAKLWAEVAELLKRAESAAALNVAEIARIAALPADEQVEAVRKELKRRNPAFDGALKSTTKDGVVTELSFSGRNVLDIAPVRALTRLQKLEITGAAVTDLSPLKGLALTSLQLNGNTGVRDLTPLKGMPLEHLMLWGWRGTDLTPLKGMPLKWLNCGGGYQKLDLTPLADLPLDFLCVNLTQVSDLTPLKKMPLTTFLCANTPVSDLTPLRGMKLKSLHLDRTNVSDLSPLQGMPLLELECAESAVKDLTPLKDLPLTKINLSFEPGRDTEPLRAIKTLQTINGKPAAEFWKNVPKK